MTQPVKLTIHQQRLLKLFQDGHYAQCRAFEQMAWLYDHTGKRIQKVRVSTMDDMRIAGAIISESVPRPSKRGRKFMPDERWTVHPEMQHSGGEN